MLFSLLYVLFRRILGTGGGPDLERDVEVLVLRHQLRVLRRKVRRPRLRRLDRVFLAAASRALPRTLLPSFIVRPETLLRAAPVAPRTGEEEMDVQEEGPPREAGARCRDQRPHPAHGPGEPVGCIYWVTVVTSEFSRAQTTLGRPQPSPVWCEPCPTLRGAGAAHRSRG